MFSKNTKVRVLVLLIGAGLLFEVPAGQAQEQLQQEIIIKVQPKIIAMPGNKVTEVPIKYARVRNTELRDLNGIYKVKLIAKVFEMKQVGNKPPEKVEVEDTYLIRCTEVGADIQKLISDYKALAVVVDAQQKSDSSYVLEKEPKKKKWLKKGLKKKLKKGLKK